MPVSVRRLVFFLFFAVASLLTAPAALHAQTPAPAPVEALTFTHRRVAVTAELGAPSVFAEYPFVNAGDRPVKVVALTATCGCTVPSLEKLDYAPGEKGVIRARFDIGDRQGKQAKRITVRTDAGEQFLDLEVDLPRRVEFRPRLALFRPGDLDPKTVTVAFSADSPVTILEVVASNPTFALTQHADEPGKRYTFTATLPATPPAVDTRATYRIRTRGASGREYNDTFFVRYIP